MQPLGRKPKTHNFIDSHLGKCYNNWWESICNDNKRGERLKIKREIAKELKDLT